jgi:hypothetical protein
VIYVECLGVGREKQFSDKSALIMKCQMRNKIKRDSFPPQKPETKKHVSTDALSQITQEK